MASGTSISAHLAAIRRKVDVPLVLHGGSGIAADSLAKAIALGVAKVNYGTYLKQRCLAAIRQALADADGNANPHHFLGDGGGDDLMVVVRRAVRDAVLERIGLLGCCGKAVEATGNCHFTCEAIGRSAPQGSPLRFRANAGLLPTIADGSVDLLVLGLAMVLAAPSLAIARPHPICSCRPAAKDVFFFIPHTHWEGAVFKTREEYLDIGLPNILRALRLLKAHPNYRFVLDQACYVKPFLERYPEEEAAFRKFVKEGRLAIVGGTDVMLDVNMPGGESFVRQVLYGKGYFRKKLGVDVTVGWQLDTFGHHAQMPQLLKLGGYKSFWFFRGVADWNTPSEFLWEGIDGSRIPAFWLPHGYGMAYGSPNTLPGFTEFIKERFDSLAPFARGRGRVGLAGGDVCEPEEHVPALVEQFNRQPNAPFELRLAVPADFEALVASRPDRPVVRGELNPIFQGIYSSRIELKQRTRELERLLTTAEKLGVLLHWLAIAGRRRDPLARLGADALQPDARPDVRRDDRSRLRRLDPRLRFLATHRRRRGPGPVAERFGRDRHAGRGHPDRGVQHAGLAAHGYRRSPTWASPTARSWT